MRLRIRGGLIRIQLGSCLGAGIHHEREGLENDKMRVNASEVKLEALGAW